MTNSSIETTSWGLVAASASVLRLTFQKQLEMCDSLSHTIGACVGLDPQAADAEAVLQLLEAHRRMRQAIEDAARAAATMNKIGTHIQTKQRQRERVSAAANN